MQSTPAGRQRRRGWTGQSAGRLRGPASLRHPTGRMRRSPLRLRMRSHRGLRARRSARLSSPTLLPLMQPGTLGMGHPVACGRRAYRAPPCLLRLFLGDPRHVKCQVGWRARLWSVLDQFKTAAAWERALLYCVTETCRAAAAASGARRRRWRDPTAAASAEGAFHPRTRMHNRPMVSSGSTSSGCLASPQVR